MPTKPENLVPLVRLILGEKVLLDADLAVLYGATCYAQCIGFDGNIRFTTGRGDLALGGY